MEGTQSIVVEAANTSFKNNTNSDFSVRLPNPLNFDSVYELALLDVSIPCTVHNVKKTNYFDLVFYRKIVKKDGLKVTASDRKPRAVHNGPNINTPVPKKRKNLDTVGDSNGLGDGEPGIYSKRKRTGPDPGENTTVKRLKPLTPSTDDQVDKAAYIAQGCVRLSLQPGYYENPKALIAAITKQGADLITNKWGTANFPLTRLSAVEPLLLSNVKDVDEKLTSRLAYESSGVYIFGQEAGSAFKRKDHYLKEYVLNIFKTSLGRFDYSDRSGLLCINPPERRGIPVSCHYSSDVGFLLGHPNRRYFRLPSTVKNRLLSPFLCRVQPASVIYIYCDQLTPSIVNNVRTNILKCVPFSSRELGFGDVFHQTYLRPTFTPINTMSLHQLSFALRGYDGNKIDFEDSTQSVRMTLEVRRRLNTRNM